MSDGTGIAAAPSVHDQIEARERAREQAGAVRECLVQVQRMAANPRWNAAVRCEAIVEHIDQFLRSIDHA